MTKKETNPNQKKIFLLAGVVAFGGLFGGYMYYSGQAKKAEREAKLRALLGSQGGAAEMVPASNGMGMPTETPGMITPPPPPALVAVSSPSDDLEQLLRLGERRAVAQAQLEALKVESEVSAEKQKINGDGATDNMPATPQPMPGAFTLAGEMPVGMGINTTPVGTGITFNESPKIPVLSSLDKLTLRYTSKVDGKIIAYVSMGESGPLISVTPGSTVEKVRITSVSEDRVCASQNKSVRCMNVYY